MAVGEEVTFHNGRPLIPFEENYDLKQKREGRADANGLEPCLFCGNGCKPLAGKAYAASVHMATDGTLLPIALTDEEVEALGQAETFDDQGWFAVGPECARKVGAEYVSR